MITTFFLQMITSVFSSLVSVLPVSTGLPTGISTAFQFVMYQVSQWTFILPIGTVLTILGYTIAIELALWGWHAGVWFYRRLRGN